MRRIASRKDSRIIDLLIAHGAAGYGIYVMLVEYLGMRRAMRSRSDIGRIAYELHADPETVRSVLEDFNLFDCTDSDFYNFGKAPRQSIENPIENPVEAESLTDGQNDDSASRSPQPDGSLSKPRSITPVFVPPYRQPGLYVP